MPNKQNKGDRTNTGSGQAAEPNAGKQLNKLKQEVAAELHLDDDIENRGWENMTTREVGKIGGNMTKKMIGYAEKQMVKKDGKIK